MTGDIVEKTRKAIVDKYQLILDKLMSASIEVDHAADLGMGSVEKKDIRTQIMRMQADFRTAEYAVPDADEWNVCRVVFFGETNAGKSTLIEALRLYYGTAVRTAHIAWGAIIGNGKEDWTKKPAYYDVRVGSCTMHLIDLPGIEGVLEGKSPNFSKDIGDELSKANVVLYIVGNEKKPERETLKKLKSYLRQDARVYAVCNVHCKGKKNRDPVVDGVYADELARKMGDVRREAAVQTAAVLKEVLGENYQGVYAINAELAFAGAAYDETCGKTLIAAERERLVLDQEIYACEFDGSYQRMRAASRLEMIVKLLQGWARDFPAACYEQQQRKLSRLIGELTARDESTAGALAVLSDLYAQMECDYSTLESACVEAFAAQESFALRIAEIPKKVASKYRTKYQKEMHRAIEEDWGGDIREKNVKQFMNAHAEEMQKFIAEEAQKKIDAARSVLQEECERLNAEIKRVEQMSLGRSVGMRFSGSGFQDEEISLKDLLSQAVEFGFGVFALSFLPGGLRIRIGAVLVLKALKYAVEADGRLAQAKAEANDFFSKRESEVAEKLSERISALDLAAKALADMQKFSQRVEQHGRVTCEIGTVVKGLQDFFRVELWCGGDSHVGVNEDRRLFSWKI